LTPTGRGHHGCDVVSKWSPSMMEVLSNDVNEPSTLVVLTAGLFTVVPRGHWHRHRDVRDLVELYFTPGTSLASDAHDPRAEGAVIVDATPPLFNAN
jgi:hypothetical protein